MASEAKWQAGSTGTEGDAPLAGNHMDQRSVESLLRRLVERVEESERRNGEALEELHARLDQLSHTTDAARATGTPDEAATLDRLHSQVNGLARRLEKAQEAEPSLDDFVKLGKALAGEQDFSSDLAPDKAAVAEVPPLGGPAEASAAGFDFTAPEAGETYAPPKLELPPLEADNTDFDKRLVDMAYRLENSIDAAMPSSEVSSLNARMAEIALKLDVALQESSKLDSLHHVEHQLSEMGQQLGRAELQIARIGGIESQLLGLIERFDDAPTQMERVASKAANEAARLTAANGIGKPSAFERLDAIHRDLVAMNDRSRTTDDRLADTLTAVHASLRQLVQQVERGREPPPAAPRAPLPPPLAPERPYGAAERRSGIEQPAMPAQPQPPRYGAAPALAEVSIEKAPSRKEAAEQTQPKDRSLRSRLGAAIPDFEAEPLPAFGRAKREPDAEEAVDLDLGEARFRSGDEDELDSPDDFVAAARRAAQAAAAQAEERGLRGSRRPRAGAAIATTVAAEPQGRRKRSILMISAALLLIISAGILYGRLKLKSEPGSTPPSSEQRSSAPATPAPSATAPERPAPERLAPGTPAPETPAPEMLSPETSDPDAASPEPSTPHGTAPVAPGGAGKPPARSGESDIPPSVRVSEAPVETAMAETTGSATWSVTVVAKSPRRAAPAAEAEASPQPQPVSLKPDHPETLVPGVSMSIEEPQAAAKMPPLPAMGSAEAVPSHLPMPPAELGPLSLRQAAASGDAKAQYAIALRYAEGQAVAQSWTEAARWLGFAASSGLAPAQYRLAVLYERGQGVGKDLGRAQSWYARAAEQGNIKAMHNLGVAAGETVGGKPDYALAAKWYAEAAAHGLADSQFNLAILEEHGLGVPKNLVDAYKWFSLAAANGDAEAVKQRDLVKLELPAAALSEDLQVLKAWKATPVKPDANEVTLPGQGQADAASSNKALVSRAQALLNKLGYDVGQPDGALGDRTRDAIKSFERRNGTAETGEVTVPLVTKLERLTS